MESAAEYIVNRENPLADLIEGVKRVLSILHSMEPKKRTEVIECLILLAFKSSQQAHQIPFSVLEQSHDNLVLTLLQGADNPDPEHRGKIGEWVVRSIFGGDS
jgi:hypothetical protein